MLKLTRLEREIVEVLRNHSRIYSGFVNGFLHGEHGTRKVASVLNGLARKGIVEVLNEGHDYKSPSTWRVYRLNPKVKL